MTQKQNETWIASTASHEQSYTIQSYSAMGVPSKNSLKKPFTITRYALFDKQHFYKHLQTETGQKLRKC